MTGRSDKARPQYLFLFVWFRRRRSSQTSRCQFVRAPVKVVGARRLSRVSERPSPSELSIASFVGSASVVGQLGGRLRV